ncbi:hypothetical protein B8A23_08955 [Staphylococcus aureus]|nr:hypothetical protein B8A23_08955 [Staphylococcus aureus]
MKFVYPQLALPVEFLYEILCVGAPSPTCTLLKSDFWSASVLGPRPQLPLPVEIGVPISLCWGPANITL